MRCKIDMEFTNKIDQAFFKTELQYLKWFVLRALYKECDKIKSGAFRLLVTGENRESLEMTKEIIEKSGDLLIYYRFKDDGLKTQATIYLGDTLFQIHRFRLPVKLPFIDTWTPENFVKKLTNDLRKNYGDALKDIQLRGDKDATAIGKAVKVHEA